VRNFTYIKYILFEIRLLPSKHPVLSWDVVVRVFAVTDTCC